MSGSARAEPLLVSLEGYGAVALTSPQSEWFGRGWGGALALRYPLRAELLLGLEVRAGAFEGAPPDVQRADAGTESFEFGLVSARLRPLAPFDDSEPQRAVGLFVDFAAGGRVSGTVTSAAIGGGLGYGIGFGDGFALAPTLRYLQLLTPEGMPTGADARWLIFGVELSMFDAHPAPDPEPLPLPSRTQNEPSDRDHDGIADLYDACQLVPEDVDGHADADGCPDDDNDADGLVDAQDGCPNAAEDRDGFQDWDGCPDPDNDRDAIADVDDSCPNEPEVVNGNLDQDGCPDAGVIALDNDRVVLEDHVLFDFEQTNLKPEARPILQALFVLIQQHPEWSRLRIEGHTDARGGAAFNLQLSERRARNVMNELIKLGIPGERIEAIGYGATRLRDTRTDEAAHQRNRRVEFVVVPHESQAPAR
jgi:outer membrane protein OmpA-like peptidoglycan-associated protein